MGMRLPAAFLAMGIASMWLPHISCSAVAAVEDGEEAACISGSQAEAEEEAVTLLQARQSGRSAPAPHLDPSCPDMTKVHFKISGFQPSDDTLPTGDFNVDGCASAALDKLSGKEVVLWLHGSGGHADDYANMFKEGRIYLGSKYNIIFLQTPRQNGSHWMSTLDKVDLNHHWKNGHVEDNMKYLSVILDQLAGHVGGHDKVWMAGFSQGAVMTSLMALKGTDHCLAGAFVVAGYPARPLYTDEGGAKDPPSDVSSCKKDTKIYFYTGELDGVLPIDKSFCRYKKVIEKYGISSSNYRFWSKTGFCHYYGDAGYTCFKQISPNGNEFHALWHVVEGYPEDVAGVVDLTPNGNCP